MIEALATGLPVVAQELADAELPPPRYLDAGIRFTVQLRRRPAAVLAPARIAVTSADVGAADVAEGTNLAAALAAVRATPGSTVAELAAATGLATPRTRRAVTELRSRGLIEPIASSGRAKRYVSTAAGAQTLAG